MDLFRRRRFQRRCASGVTLLELLTVLVVIGILAAIAVPSYQSYLLRANRTDAKSALLQVQAAEEKFYLQNNAYTDKLTDAPPAGLGMLDVSRHGYYKIRFSSFGADKQGYKATADPVAGQIDDTQCGSFSLTDTGARTISGTGDVSTCWK